MTTREPTDHVDTRSTSNLAAGTYGETGVAVVDAIPASYYTDPKIFELEGKLIFDKAWQCLGHISMAPKSGDYFTGSIIDQQIIIARGDDDILRAFYNVCQHRGHQLVEGSGHCRRFVCPYHAWTYNLDGSLKAAPQTKNLPMFNPADIRLKEIRLETFCGLVFVNMDPEAASLAQEFGFLEGDIRRTVPNIEQQRLVFEHPIVHRSNWKASVENFSECYHCGPVHHYLTANVIDSASYQLTVAGRSQRHFIKGRDAALEQHLWFLWPNTAFGLYPVPGVGMVFCIRNMYPVKFDETIYHYRWFAAPGIDETKIVEYATHHAETTGAEDAAVASGAQRGMNSRGFTHGLLFANPASSATSEHAIAAFHRWVLDAHSASRP